MPDQLTTSTPATLPPDDFVGEVRSALIHLYDNAYLQNHPLAQRFAQNGGGDTVTRAQRMRRLLLDSIGKLRSEEKGRPSREQNELARAYVVLSYRCIDGMTMEEIEQKLALSRRQTYREYSKGVEAVASQLWDLLAPEAERATSARRELAEVEVERLTREDRREPVAIGELIAGVCQLLARRMDETGITISSQIDPALTVKLNRTMLRQALINLLSHALDTVPKQCAIEMSACCVGEALIVRAAEAGELQNSSRTAPLIRREGVGITLAQTLIESLGGKLLRSTKNDLWWVEIHLPLNAAVSSHPTLLLVDDNEDLRALFRRYLAGHKINICSTHSSSDALELAIKTQPNLIVLDVMMPKTDGWELLQSLRSHPQTSTIPLVMCSVLREQPLALSLGATDYLIKPVSQPQLLEVLQRWLGKLHPNE